MLLLDVAAATEAAAVVIYDEREAAQRRRREITAINSQPGNKQLMLPLSPANHRFSSFLGAESSYTRR